MVVNEPNAHIRHAFLEVLGKPGYNGPLFKAAIDSKRVFARSSAHLTEFENMSDGRPITALEATMGYGPEVVAKLTDKPAVGLVRKGGDIFRSIKVRRDSLGVTEDQMATADRRFAASDVTIVEANRPVPSVFTLTRMAEALALKDYQIGAVTDGGGDRGLAYRLRELSSRNPSGRVLTPAVALALTEAAWVIATQVRLADWISTARDETPPLHLRPAPTALGSLNKVAFREGYELAHMARGHLGLSWDEPVHDLDRLIEERLGVPVIQVHSPGSFAGATISNNSDRGIVVNLNSHGGNAFGRRMTLAHELGHLLCDPDDELKNLKVDMAEVFEKDSQTLSDRIESRANAFAAEFLAPREAVTAFYYSSDNKQLAMDVLVDRYGVGFTAMSWQLKNSPNLALDRNAQLPSSNLAPSAEWQAEVGRTTDFFIFKSTPAARTGRFAKYVSDSVRLNLITDITAAEYLKLPDDGEDRNELAKKIADLQGLV